MAVHSDDSDGDSHNNLVKSSHKQSADQTTKTQKTVRTTEKIVLLSDDFFDWKNKEFLDNEPLRGCEKIVASTPSARRTERRKETYQIDRRGTSTGQRSDWSAQ